jgi:16S rRNA processing protein RimM
MSGRVSIGTVVRAHGVRGLLRVRSDGDSLTEVKRVFIDGRVYTVERVMPERGEHLVQLAGVLDRDQADALRGRAVEIERSDLPPAGEDELYAGDLVGCQVYDAAGALLGEVIDSFPGAQEILVVKGAREFMLPMIEPIVTSVDVTARRIVCDPPVGLIDLDEAES